MNLYRIPNLSSSIASPCSPWEGEINQPPSMEPEVAKHWGIQNSTDGMFVSGFEGRAAAMRVTKDNPAARIHAFIADYDAELTNEDFISGIGGKTKAGLKPMYAHRTPSGGARVVWMFEEPMQIPAGLIPAFLKRVAKELGAKRIFPGLDENHVKPEQYYAWYLPVTKVGETPLRTETVYSWFAATIDADHKYRGEGPVEIPMDRVRNRVQELYPDKLLGQLEVGTRTNAFWTPTSDNPTACVVTPTGIVSFSQDKSFYTWSDILGSGWVKEFEEDRLGAPLANYYYDGKRYWRQDGGGSWRDTSEETSRKDIAGIYGLSLAPMQRGGMCEVDQTMLRVRETRRVDEAGPMLFSKEEVVHLGTRKILNISRVKVLEPRLEVCEKWGDGFPWIAKFLDGFFNPHDSLEYFLAWLHHFYTSAKEGKQSQGQAIFIAGPVGVGKTLMGTQIVSRLMGGGCDASGHISGESEFNAEMFEVGVLNVDDTIASTSHEKHLLFSNTVKKFVANRRHRYRAMWKNPTTIEWSGRVFVTLNDDPDSMRAVPYTDASILDKLMLFKASAVGTVFPNSKELQRILDGELPAFARWLTDMEIPDSLRSSSRFEVKCYHHADILEDTRTTHPNHAFSELLDEFMEGFNRANPKDTTWRGSATQLLNQMLNDTNLTNLTRHYASTPEKMGQRLAKLMTTKKIERVTVHGKVLWKIPIDEPHPVI